MIERYRHVGLALLIAALNGCGGATGDRNDDRTSPGLSGIRYLGADDGQTEGFAQATAVRDFVFPADHAAHPDFRTEWWYFTGNVFDA
jgi:predicted secreted hydrolase